MGWRTGHIAIQLFLISLMLCAGAVQTDAQPRQEQTFRGVIWTPPAAFSEMRQELEMMSEFGIRAVRVNLVLDENVHLVTDMFGVELFQEIDLSFSPAHIEQEEIENLSAQIDSALQIAAEAGRFTHLGFGYWNDTSDPWMCEVIATLAEQARQFGTVSTYYTTPFIESDRCSDVVDFVLLDLHTDSDPADALARWHVVHQTPAGIAALGAPVFSGADDGYRVDDSPESQARHIEHVLHELNGDDQVVALFVDRWIERDPTRLASISVDGDFGILRPDGTTRPAADVVKGFYTGEQKVFAFPAGSQDPVDYSWLNLIAFVLAALFGLTYYTSLDLRSLLRRYFVSHSFYLEKVGDGRDISMGVSLFLLVCLSISASIVGMTIVTHIQDTNLWYALSNMLPDPFSWSLRAGARYPVLLMLGFASIFALVTLIWAGGLSAVTLGTRRLGPGQALLLAVMPRWPVAIVGLLALVVLNWQLDAPIIVVVLILAVWSGIVLVYTGRMFSDYLRLLGISALVTIPVLFLGLLLVAATGWLFLVTQDMMPDMIFLWNLATKT